MSDGTASVPPPVSSPNDAAVLGLIGEEELDGFSFDGLKRKLRLHPETLSRALTRLEELEMVQKDEDGYKVTPKARETIPSRQLSTQTVAVPLLHTLLPFDVSVHEVISDLQGRWFGMLRWLGYSEEEGGVTLKWTTRDGRIQVDASFSDMGLQVEAKLQSRGDMNLAIRASYQLIAYVSRVYSKQEAGFGVSLLSLYPRVIVN